MPEVVSVQTPTLPATSQASHWPPHAELQQKPSTHELEVQLALLVQTAPLATFAEQCPVPSQKFPAAQSVASVDTVQVPRQAVPAVLQV